MLSFGKINTGEIMKIVIDLNNPETGVTVNCQGEEVSPQSLSIEELHMILRGLPKTRTMFERIYRTKV